MNSKVSDSGNGGGYEGKLTYYRFVPDLTCEGQQTYKEMLVFDQNQIWLYENSSAGQSCQQRKSQLESKDIGVSPFQSEFVVVHDYLYAQYEMNSGKVPDLLAESLCRDNWEKPNFEITNHYNYRTGEATTRVYSVDRETGQIQMQMDASTNRLLTPFEVSYQSFNQRLKFNLNLQQGDGEYLRQFKGQITYVDPTLSEVLKPIAMKCVTGGGLDSSVWPIKKVDISSTISKFFVHPTQNDIYFDDRNPNSVNWWRPFVLQNESKLIDVSAEIFKTTMYVGSHKPIENSKWMTLEGVETNGTPYFGGNVYIYSPDDPSTLRTLVKNQSQNSFIPTQNIVASRIQQLSEAEFGFWIVNRTFVSPNSTAQETYFYRILNWKTQQNRDFLTAKAASGIAQRLYFKDMTWPKGMVGNLSLNAAGKYEIHYMDIVDRIEKIRDLPEMDSCNPVASNGSYDIDRFFISKESRMAVIEFKCADNSRKVLGISVENGNYYLTGPNDTLIWISSDGETFMVSEANSSTNSLMAKYNPQKIRVVQAKTGLIEASQMDPHLSNSSDSTQFSNLTQIYYGASDQVKTYAKNGIDYLVGFSPGSQWTVQLKNLTTRVESTVCKNAIGQKIAIRNFTDNQVALITFEPGQRIMVYEVSESENCKLLNSAPVKYKAIRVLVPTKSGLGVAISSQPGYNSYMSTKTPDDIYFLNKDGRAPLHINLNNPNFSIIVDMQVSFDHSKLYILGTGIETSIYQTLFWLKL